MMRRRIFLFLLTAIILGCDLPETDRIAKMDEAAFWVIIDRVKGHGGEEAHSNRLARELERLSNDQLVQFYVLYQKAFDRANFDDLWAVGALLNGGHGSDDDFEYFRNWLIAQGSSVYSLATSSPDSLALVDVEFQDGLPTAEWELFGRIPSEVFDKRGGATLYRVAEPFLKTTTSEKAPLFDWTAYSDEIMAVRLPKLWAKYGEIKMRRDQRIAASAKEYKSRVQKQEFEIPGLGNVKAGVVLYHKKFGAGTVIDVDTDGQHFSATISFSDAVRPMSLTALPELFSREPFK